MVVSHSELIVTKTLSRGCALSAPPRMAALPFEFRHTPRSSWQFGIGSTYRRPDSGSML